jgi:flagellar assembly protein FliH
MARLADAGPDAIPAPPHEPPAIDVADRLAALSRDAFAKGYAEGEREGERAVRDRVETELARLARGLDDLLAFRLDLLRRSERQLLQLALAIADRIVQREVSVDPLLLESMARRAIERVGHQPVATIHLHPLDHAALSATRGGHLPEGAIDVVADPTLDRGACLVRLAEGQIDASADAQMQEITRALLGDAGDAAADDRDVPATGE